MQMTLGRTAGNTVLTPAPAPHQPPVQEREGRREHCVAAYTTAVAGGPCLGERRGTVSPSPPTGAGKTGSAACRGAPAKQAAPHSAAKERKAVFSRDPVTQASRMLVRRHGGSW